MPLPKVGSKEWDEEVKFYQTATHNQRVKRAEQLGYIHFDSYGTQMNKRGIRLLKDTPKITTDYKIPDDFTLSDHLRIIREHQQLIAPHIRTPETVNITIPTELPIGIVKTADWQLGQFGVDYETFETDIDTIAKEPGVYTNVGGDGIENIIQPSKMGSSHNQEPIAVQKAVMVLVLQKLFPKLLSIESGNHIDWDAALTGEDWLGEKARQLKAVYIKDGGRLNYYVGDQVYPEFIIHKGRFNSSFNQTHSNKQMQRMFAPWARITTIEHHHIADVESYRYDGKECVAIRPGTYAVYDARARAEGFFGAHVCNPMVVLFPDQDKLVVFKDMYDGIKYLRTVRKEYVRKRVHH